RPIPPSLFPYTTLFRSELDVHDVINVFQVTGLMPDDERYFMKTSPAQVGDHFELFCELDLLMAVSNCPGGDLSVPIWGPESGGEDRKSTRLNSSHSQIS